MNTPNSHRHHSSSRCWACHAPVDIDHQVIVLDGLTTCTRCVQQRVVFTVPGTAARVELVG